MKTRRVECDYNTFKDPYTGLAAMVFVQADSDLTALDGKSRAYVGREMLDKWEIINFLRSPWAALLATGIGLDVIELNEYTARMM